jgi:hypothetical protein
MTTPAILTKEDLEKPATKSELLQVLAVVDKVMTVAVDDSPEKIHIINHIKQIQQRVKLGATADNS